MSTVPAMAGAGRRLAYLPVGFFGSVMGLTGLSVAWRLAGIRYGLPASIANWLAALAVLVFVLLSIGYAVKGLSAPDAVRVEFTHPVAGNLFGTPLIGLLLLAIVIAPWNLLLARCLWGVGAVAMLAFSWLVIDRWMNERQQLGYATPAWIVPVVGLLDIPLAMPSLQLPELHGVMVLAMAVGMFFAIPLFTIVFSRLVFDSPLPDPLQPTLMILLAPFAVGTSTYVATTGTVDLFAQSLYALTLFMFAVLVGRLRYLAQCCPFRISWWAVSFPVAAAAIAALRVALAYPGWLTDSLAIGLLTTATALVAWLLVRTIVGIAQGELRTLSN